MPRANPNDVVTFRSEDVERLLAQQAQEDESDEPAEGWLPNSFLTLRKTRTDGDRVAINELTADVDVEVAEPEPQNRAERRARGRRGGVGRTHVHTTIRFSRHVATLAVMEVAHGGDEFTEGGPGTAPIPFHPDPAWRAKELASLDKPHVLEAIFEEMEETVWRGRTRAEQGQFRGRDHRGAGRPAYGVGPEGASPDARVEPAPAGLVGG